MKQAVVYVLFLSLIGLAFFQYELLKGSLLLSKSEFDGEMTEVLSELEEELSNKNELTHLLGQAILRDTSFFTMPSEALIDTTNYFLNDFLKYQLERKGITTDFQYEIVNTQQEEVLRSKNFNAASTQTLVYRLSLKGYLSTVAKERYFIKIHILNGFSYFLKSLTTLFIPNLIFLLLIIGCSIWLIRVLYWEKHLNDTTQEFINNLTHELKTPVFSIALASKILQEKTTDADSSKLIEMIRRDNDRLKNHIDKVLSLAKLEKRQAVMQLETVDFQPIFDSIVQHWYDKISLLEGKLTSENKATNTIVKIDKEHITNVLENILDNAVKYSNDKPFVHFLMENRKNQLVIIIKDEGIGIDKKLKRRIFDKFYRVPERNNLHTVKGYGLGLNYAKRVIKLHKGKIAIDSELGSGTTVTIYLPQH